MMRFFFLLLCSLLTHLSQAQVKMSVDKNGLLTYELINTSNLRTKAGNKPNIEISAKPDPIFGDTEGIIEIKFPNSVNIDSVRTITIICAQIQGQPFLNPNSFFLRSRFGRHLSFSHKAINKTERILRAKIGGLKPNSVYQVYAISLMNGIQDSYVHNNVITFKTLEENRYTSKKLLFVIDKDLENDIDIQNALNQYVDDLNNLGEKITIEKHYFSNSTTNKPKWELYNLIKEKFNNVSNPLRYLFFIGANAMAQPDLIVYSPANTITLQRSDISINFYTQIYNPQCTYDPSTDKFLTRKYRYHEFVGLPKNDITSAVMQSNDFDIAYGAILPNSSILSKKATILKYFTKLHDFKTLKLTFDKSVLFSDTMFDDTNSPSELFKQNGRWHSSDVINLPKYEFGLNNSGTYPEWTRDYISKLSTKSYEIGFYMGHGSPTLHYFEVTPKTIQNLPQLNTMLLDFNSCSVGDFTIKDYLAGSYFDQGNTLFVKAYTTPVFIAIYDKKSPLIDYFSEGELFNTIMKNGYFADAYINSSTGIINEIHLGDPLLRLDPVVLTSGLPIESAICEKGSLIIPFSINSKIAGETGTLTVELLNSDNKIVATFKDVGKVSPLKIDLTSNIAVGKYKARVISSNTNIGTQVSSIFTINALPKVSLSKIETKDNISLKSNYRSGNQWLYEGKEIANATDSVYIPDKVGNYTLKVKDNLGCSALSNSVLVSINTPTLTLIGENPFCEGTSTKIKSSVEFSIYKWIVAGDTVSNNQIEYDVKKTGIYRLIGLKGKIRSPVSNILDIKTKPFPPTPIIMIESFALKSSSTTGNQWFLNEVSLKDSTNQYLKFPKSGSYSVKVNQNDCVASSLPLAYTLTGIDDCKISELKVFPNPNPGVFYVSLSDISEAWQIDIFDISGKHILNRKSQNRDVNGIYEKIEVKSTGIYWIKISTKTNSVFFKTVVY